MPNDVNKKSILNVGEFKLVFEEHPGYFFACIEGNSTDSEAVDQYQATIAAEISIRQFDRVMIKRDVPLTNNSGQHCGVIYKVRGWEMRRIKYAFVDENPQHLSAYNLALLFANQYGIEAEVFGEVPAAKIWLLS